ncbi:transcription termination/antitermination protein NusG [Haematobacter genomosp. 1]|nr:transcription termination/antitermination NusG family protein [Haematobacter genomosp. 1]
MDFNATGLSVGDVVRAGDDLAAVFGAGPARWHALRVAPQREDQAEAWLRRRGVYAFHPVLMHKVRRMGKVREYARRYLPGYVFARFPGEAVPHRLVGRCGITGALMYRLSGSWAILKPSDLQALHDMRKIDAETAQERRAIRSATRRALTVHPGGTALFREGAFSGMRCEVVELLADGGAKVRVNVFGAMISTKTHAADLIGIVGRC